MFNGNNYSPCLINSFKADTNKLMGSYSSFFPPISSGSPFKPPTPPSLTMGSSSSENLSTIPGADGYHNQIMSQALAMMSPGMSPVSYGIGNYSPGMLIVDGLPLGFFSHQYVNNWLKFFVND